ncbi:hypothetical protein VTI74DRAFT_2274 [Chaetomium olivicolor]
MPTTSGSFVLFETAKTTKNAPVVARLLDGGAITFWQSKLGRDTTPPPSLAYLRKLRKKVINDIQGDCHVQDAF